METLAGLGIPTVTAGLFLLKKHSTSIYGAGCFFRVLKRSNCKGYRNRAIYLRFKPFFETLPYNYTLYFQNTCTEKCTNCN